MAAVVIALAAVAAYYNSFAGVFSSTTTLWIVEQHQHLASLADLAGAVSADTSVGPRPARGQPDAGDQLRPGRNERLGLSRREPRHPRAGGLDAVRRRAADALACPGFANASAGRHAVGPGRGPASGRSIPLQTESVTYIIQRTEALVGLFYLLTLYCVIRGATSRRSMSWYAAAVAACLLGMATKEVMATAPVIVLLYDRTFLAGSFREAWRRRYGLYLALAATWGVVALC